MKLKIEYVSKNDLKPYVNNAKIHTAEQVEQIKKSIEEFGFNDPIAIWKDNEIIEGHGRLLAVMEMDDIDKVPIIRLDSLTDEQRKAYTLVHNKLTMNTDFDADLLDLELMDIVDIDMESYGFDIFDENFDFEFYDNEKDDREEEYEDEDDRLNRLKYNVFENQERKQFYTDNYYGIPDMEATQTFCEKFLRFQDWSEISEEECREYIVHFYYDDFKFIQAWRNPDKYVERLRRFKAVISPDFSLYTDFPRALQILSCYRRQWCGAYWQSLGLDVIPDVIWGDKESYNYCFDGIPEHSVVAVSSVGVALDNDWNGEKSDMFKDGYEEMLNRLKPTKILYYGTLIDGLDGDIIRIPSFYEEKRKMLDEMKEKKNG